jgi:methionyl-tRNA synthetase
MPETGDTDFSWAEFIRRNNDELVATYGNLVNRVLSFTHKNFDGKIPEFTNLSNEDNELLNQCRSIMHEVDQDLYNCKFKAAITKSFGLAQKCNRYLDFSAPWKEIKNDRDRTGTILWTSIAAINCLRVMLSPFLPFSSSDISSMLNISEDVFGWDVDLVIEQIVPNTLFNTPSPLFKKLDLEEVNQ